MQFKAYLDSKGNHVYTYSFFDGEKDYQLLTYNQNKAWEPIYMKTAIKLVNNRVKYGVYGSYFDKFPNQEEMVKNEAEMIVFENDFKWKNYEEQKRRLNNQEKLI